MEAGSVSTLPDKRFVLGIDATNIRAGGGLKHLKELLSSQVNPTVYGIDKVVVFTSADIDVVPYFNNIHFQVIQRSSNPLLNFFKQRVNLRKAIASEEIDLLFCPGGTYPGKSIPYVSMSQNMLVFEKEERRRFPLGFNRLRYNILRLIQTKSFANSVGNIFISEYARNYITALLPKLEDVSSSIIPLGATEKFRKPPRKQKEVTEYNSEFPLQLTYISIVNHYKHQWNVIEAVKKIRDRGIPLSLNLIGSINPSVKSKFDPIYQANTSFVKYHGSVSYQEIEQYYHNTDIFVFASTCENMPNVLVEAMSAGLPIACSDYGPMPEILKDAGVYFDPLEVSSIVSALEILIEQPQLRYELATKANNYAKSYSWDRCAMETYTYFQKLTNK